MPNRILRDYTDSVPVNSLDWLGECLFVRLIQKADDFGRFHGNPTLVRSLLFPLKDGLRDADIAARITACEEAGLIRAYESNGKPFVEIVNFGQRLKNNTRSKFPNPPWLNIPDCPGQSRTAPENTARGERREARDEGGGDIPAHGESPPTNEALSPLLNGSYPQTVADVVSLAGDAGVLMPENEAERYLTIRSASDWVDASRRKIRPANVKADIKKWMLNNKASVGQAPGTVKRSGGNFITPSDNDAFAETWQNGNKS